MHERIKTVEKEKHRQAATQEGKTLVIASGNGFSRRGFPFSLPPAPTLILPPRNNHTRSEREMPCSQVQHAHASTPKGLAEGRKGESEALLECYIVGTGASRRAVADRRRALTQGITWTGETIDRRRGAASGRSVGRFGAIALIS